MWRKLVLLVIGLSLLGLMGCASRAAKQSALEEEPLYPMTKELKDDITRLESDITQLNGETAELNKRVSNLDSRISLLNQEIKSSTAAPITTLKTTMPPLPATGDVQALYNEALEDYYARHYNWALDKFSQLISHHPRSSLADNGQYWLAECYYGLEDFAKAIEEFQKVFSYAETEKDDDAQLKLGFCYANLGNSTQAIAEFRKLLNLYPDSEYADVARMRIAELSP
jgi:tol-pal system protein YbgF